MVPAILPMVQAIFSRDWWPFTIATTASASSDRRFAASSALGGTASRAPLSRSDRWRES
jgi:hypothetical protein